MLQSTATLPRLLNAGEVSSQTGIPEWRIYELSRLGLIPVVRVGRSYRYSAPAIQKWIETGGTGELAD